MPTQQYLIHKVLSHHTCHQGILLPINKAMQGGVIAPDGTPIPASTVVETDQAYYPYDPTHVETAGNAIFIGHLINTWGHTFTDNVKKLWFLRTNLGRQLLQEGYHVIYTVERNLPGLQKTTEEMLRRAGLNITHCQEITCPTQFETIVVPDNSLIMDSDAQLYTQEYVETIDYIIHTIPDSKVSTPPSKIYFTRTHLHQKYRDYGEAAVERTFRRAGYTIVAPEEHSVEEQLTMLQHCSHFAATEGSVSHNSLFCNPNCHVTILPKADFVNPYQKLINEIRSYTYSYVTAHHSVCCYPVTPWSGPFYLYPSRELLQHLQLHTPYIPFWLRPSYWRYIFRFKIWLPILLPPLQAIRRRLIKK